MNTVAHDAVNEGQLFDPHSYYFLFRKNLFVWGTFTHRILQYLSSPVASRGCEGLIGTQITRDMSDEEVIDEMLGGDKEASIHAITLDQVAEMIDFQPNGEDGELLNDGHANIFYSLASGVLSPFSVRYSLHCHEWDIRGWPLGNGGKYRSGDRVFRNTTLTIQP